MTQKSYVWGGTAIGDAIYAPYNDDEWADIWSFMHQYDRTTQGPITTARVGYTGGLAVTNSSGTTIRVATGAAIVDGRLYTNSANVDEDVNGRGTGYYRVVLQEHEANQTIRVLILGPQAGTPPSVTQSAAIWEISLATFYFDDSTNTVSALTDTRDFVETPFEVRDDSIDDTKAGNRVPQFYRRQGGDTNNWQVPGTTSYTPSAVRMQAGVKYWTGSSASSGSLVVTFPVAFSYLPVVFANVLGDSYSHSITIAITPTSVQTATIYWKDHDGPQTVLQFKWLAVGSE